MPLGGSGAVQGLPPSVALGQTQAIATTELRWLALHNASVPIPLAWGSDMQLSGGVDVGRITDDEAVFVATGWNAGIAFVADILGADPNFGGIWLAGPVWSNAAALEDDGLQLYVRISQPF